MPASQQICTRPGCNKPVYIEVNGFAHPYCGKTCAFIALNNPQQCKNPTCSRTKYANSNGFQYDYCGKTCARRHLDQTNQEAPICSQPNCPKRVYVDSQDKTRFHSFCSPACYWLECSTLTNTKLSLLNKNDLDFIWAHQRFISKLPQAKIKEIIRLQMPKSLVDAHLRLKKQMANRHGLSLNAVTHKMFHGTGTICDPLQYIQRLSPNCSSGCGLCGIVTRGNDKDYSKHGDQMWFANDPRTSNGYCKGNYVATSKVIFMVDVLSKSPNAILIVDQNAATLPRFLVIFQDGA